MRRDLAAREKRLGVKSLDPRVSLQIIHRLVNSVWLGKSGLSECDDASRLCLVRFCREQSWTPWNSLLLTKEEADLHESIANLDDVYDASLVRKFRRRNLQARLYFESITKLAKHSGRPKRSGGLESAPRQKSPRHPTRCNFSLPFFSFDCGRF